MGFEGLLLGLGFRVYFGFVALQPRFSKPSVGFGAERCSDALQALADVDTAVARLCYEGFARFASKFRAEVITYTILGVPYYKYGIMGPKTLF